jgi:hypothetical protein
MLGFWLPLYLCRSASGALRSPVRWERICSDQLRIADGLAFGGESYLNDRAEPRVRHSYSEPFIRDASDSQKAALG